jgi:hypothetical protein
LEEKRVKLLLDLLREAYNSIEPPKISSSVRDELMESILQASEFSAVTKKKPNLLAVLYEAVGRQRIDVSVDLREKLLRQVSIEAARVETFESPYQQLIRLLGIAAPKGQRKAAARLDELKEIFGELKERLTFADAICFAVPAVAAAMLVISLSTASGVEVDVNSIGMSHFFDLGQEI